MCGLVGVISKKKKHTGQKVYNLYKKQETRGKDGYGYIAINDGKIVNIVRATTEEAVRKHIMNERAEIVLFHHRKPTSTVNTLRTTHPMFVSNDELEYDYYFMHNGVVTNTDWLKARHEEKGYKYTTESIIHEYMVYADGHKEFVDTGKNNHNDSESLAIELARFADGKSDNVNTYGAAAFLGVKVEKGTDNVLEIMYGQNYGRSLKSEENNKWRIITSETGEDVEQMKMFIITIDNMKEWEMELDFDTARPRSTVSTGRSTGYSWNPDWDDHDTDTVIGEAKLVNALYTKQEAIDTGVPFSRFSASSRICVDSHFVQMYIPQKFIGIDFNNRPLYKDVQFKQKALPSPYQDPYEEPEQIVLLDPDTDERLEEICMKIANIQADIEELEEWLDSGSLDKVSYEDQSDTLILKKMAHEDELASLDVDEETVSKMMDQCEEVVDYERVYNQS